jgi:pimeloyl-ACP methyl ester carboxylesterase|tara:strand:- start:8226 stop:9254 length:1029 start_codon:yes stop_codon:yes gene_type:complete
MRKVFSWSVLCTLSLLLFACSDSSNKKSSGTITSKTENSDVEVKDLKLQLIDEFGPYQENITEDNKRLYRAYNRAMKLWDTPFHEVNIPTRYGNAHIIVTGPKSGKKLVLLHGLNATSTMWYPNIMELSKDFRVYSIDFLLDPSKSNYNEEAESLDAVMLWHDDIFRKLKLDTFSLVGASRGGWLAVNIAVGGKYAIEKLVLLSPAQTFTWMPHSTDMFKNIQYSFAPKRKKFREILSTLSSNVDNIDQSFIDLHFIATKNAKISKFMVQMRPFSNEKFESLSMPTLLLIGDDDLFNQEKSIEKARELIPNVETKKIKNAGHFLSIDQANTVNRLMLEFLMK